MDQPKFLLSPLLALIGSLTVSCVPLEQSFCDDVIMITKEVPIVPSRHVLMLGYPSNVVKKMSEQLTQVLLGVSP